MDENTLVQAIIQTGAKVDFLWQFFMTVHIALFALLFIYDKAVDSINPLGRLLAICGIGVFDYINGNALQNTYKVLHAMHAQYRASFGLPERFVPEFYEMFVQTNLADRPEIVLITHSIAFSVVALAFLWRRFIATAPADR